MDKWKSIVSFSLPTKIVFGSGCVKSLNAQLEELGVNRPLIVTGHNNTSNIARERIVTILPSKTKYTLFDGVDVNPKDINVLAGASVYRTSEADSLIAVGGGSPIDCAKAIGVLVANEADDIRIFENNNAVSKPIPPLICIPTTSGSGSEITFSSVITNTKENYKMTIKNNYIVAKTALCDPDLTLGMPDPLTASTGLDALTHAIEAFTATCAEPLSDAVALYAIELIYQSLLLTYNDGNNLLERSKMMVGSMLAGIAFSHSDVASVHCISEALGGMYDLPHGICNAILLPYVMEYNMDFCINQYARIARAMGYNSSDEKECAKKAIAAVRTLTYDLSLPAFSSLRIEPADYQVIAQKSAKNGSNSSNPRPMKEKDYLNVLEMALKNYSAL